MAVANYHDAFGCFPPAYIADESGRPIHSWRVLLLPYLDQAELYEDYDFSEPWDGPNNRKLLSRCPRIYIFPGQEDSGQVTTNYVGVTGPGTFWSPGQAMTYKKLNQADGSSSTIMVVENQGSGILWMEPRDLDFATMSLNVSEQAANGISSPYDQPGVAMADGQARIIPRDLSPETLRAWLTYNGGEQVDYNTMQVIDDGRTRPRRED